MGIPATALLVDMRDFTSTYQRSTDEGREAEFLARLERFYDEVAGVCLASFGGAPGDELYLSSTGDGVLAIFLDDAGGIRHGLRAYLAALRLLHELPTLLGSPSVWKPGFGIGLECGTVTRVGKGPLATCIGHCVNLAARLEQLTKTFAATSLVIGQDANALLARELHDPDLDYHALAQRAFDESLHELERQGLWEQMRAANDSLALLWLGNVNLKGVEPPPLALRSSPTALRRSGAQLIAKIEERLGLG
jgi:class 3 adenylate cyclase